MSFDRSAGGGEGKGGGRGGGGGEEDNINRPAVRIFLARMVVY